ncbi:MAG: hypothetical protein WBM11_17610 [Terriglobales bacterium]
MNVDSEKTGTPESPIRPDSWAAAWLWLAYTLFYGFMPVWLGVLALLGFSFNRSMNWRDFLIHGEFLIYSASLVAASTRLITRDVESGRSFPHRPWFNLISHAVIIPSAAVYAIAKALSFSESPLAPRGAFILYFSLVMVVSGVVFSFVVFLFDHRRSSVPYINIQAERKHEQEDLSRSFDKLEKGEHA